MNLIKKCRYGLMIYNSKDIWVGRSIQKYGEFSESEVQLFRDVIKPGDIVLDIGANIGCHTLAFSRIVGNTGCVFAYEPERFNFTTLAGNVSLNNLINVYVFQKAVGASSGHILVPELDQDQTYNWGGLNLCDHDYSNAPNYSVPLTTVDEQNFLKINFIKIDIEGMEKMALEGAKESITKFKPIIYVENDRKDREDLLISFLKSMDYKCYSHTALLYNQNNYFDDKEDVFFTVGQDNKNYQIASFNLFCYHKDAECPIDVNKFAMTAID